MAHPLLKRLGSEPLHPDFNGQWLFDLSRRRKLAVKQFIMDSQIVVGVGNIYANESLYKARVLPTRPANDVSLLEYVTIVASIREVLSQAIDLGGTTLRNFVNESGKPGYFKQQLNVYGRGGQPCYCCGQKLVEQRLASRSSVFCLACQH